MIVVQQQPNLLAFTKGVFLYLLILRDRINLKAAIEELGNCQGNQISQVRVPHTQTLVGVQLPHQGLLGLEESLILGSILHHTFNGCTAEHVVHGHIFVVALGNCTIETVAIAIHGLKNELLELQQGLNAGERTGHFGISERKGGNTERKEYRNGTRIPSASFFISIFYLFPTFISFFLKTNKVY